MTPIFSNVAVPHPIDGETVRALKRYLAVCGNDGAPWLFLSERRGQLTRQAVNYLLSEIGFRADLGRVHPICCDTHVDTPSRKRAPTSA